MTRVWAIATACTALALANGCGSGGSNGTTAAVDSSTGTASSSPSSTAATSKSGAGATSKSSPSGGIKYGTTPKYASPSPSESVQSGVVQIAYRNIAIDPDTVRVKVGSTVRWTNYDPVEHNVTSRGGPVSFASKNFGESHTFEVKMTKAGTIHYLCTNHPATMNGTIEVVN